MFPFLLVGIGGAIGSMTRYGTGLLIARIWPTTFPLGILLINIIGSTAMGLFVGLMARFQPAWAEDARLFVAVGLIGGFTTFSSFSLDTIVLIERGELLQAAFYVLLSVVVCLIGLYLGILVTRGVA